MTNERRIRRRIKTVLVDNHTAADVPMIRPSINKVRCKLLRIVPSDYSPLYVVEYKGDEVYLSRHEIIR